MNYSQDYLTSSWWESRKYLFKLSTHLRCFLCRSKDRLDVHHKRYRDKSGSILFREKHTDLRLLCRSCHFAIHDLSLEEVLAKMNLRRTVIRDKVKEYRKHNPL